MSYLETQALEVQCIDKAGNKPRGMVLWNPVIQSRREKEGLIAICFDLV